MGVHVMCNYFSELRGYEKQFVKALGEGETINLHHLEPLPTFTSLDKFYCCQQLMHAR